MTKPEKRGKNCKYLLNFHDPDKGYLWPYTTAAVENALVNVLLLTLKMNVVLVYKHEMPCSRRRRTIEHKMNYNKSDEK
jgi:hypothetical protein